MPRHWEARALFPAVLFRAHGEPGGVPGDQPVGRKAPSLRCCQRRRPGASCGRGLPEESCVSGLLDLLHSGSASWPDSDSSSSSTETSQRPCRCLSVAPGHSFSLSSPSPDTPFLLSRGRMTLGSPSPSPRKTPGSWHIQYCLLSYLGADPSLKAGPPCLFRAPQPAAGPTACTPSLAPCCLREAWRRCPDGWLRLQQECLSVAQTAAFLSVSRVPLRQRAGAGGEGLPPLSRGREAVGQSFYLP